MRLRLQQIFVVIILASFLAACGGSPQIDRKTKLKRQIDASYNVAVNRFGQLTQSLKNGTMTNAIILKSYKKAALKKKPEHKDIINVLASEGTINGPTYVAIKARIAEATKLIPTSLDNIESGFNLNQEFQNIAAASEDYDAMLVDAINVLADFTGGDLPKLRELEYEGEAASSEPAGSEYVGNSNYGQWKQSSNGSSFWVFYAQYAMFSALYPRPVYYDHWSVHRRPSYYHDYGRDYYSSPAGRKNRNTTLSNTKKNYSSKGKSFKSTYAKAKPTIKGAPKGTKPAFKSQYASNRSSSSSASSRSSNSSYSRSSSSSRSSSYNSRSSGSSRSSSRGK